MYVTVKEELFEAKGRKKWKMELVLAVGLWPEAGVTPSSDMGWRQSDVPVNSF